MHLPVTGRPAKGSGRREKEGTARAARCPGKVRDSTGRTGPRVGGGTGARLHRGEMCSLPL